MTRALEKHRRRVPPAACAIVVRETKDGFAVEFLAPTVGDAATGRAIPKHVVAMRELARHTERLMRALHEDESTS